MATATVTADQVKTTGQVARALGVELAMVERLIAAHKIEPAAWAGHVRLWSPGNVETIRAELERLKGDPRHQAAERRRREVGMAAAHAE